MIENKLKDIRKEKGIGQSALADAIGVDQSYISQLESGIRPINLVTLDEICEYMKCTPNDILGFRFTKGDEDNAGNLQT